ncbi:MAG: response regulator [Proteobacteria bacterium]|nr:response regulator [Pseudomonadota bacterium]
MAVRTPSHSDRNPAARGIDRQNVLKGRRVVVADDSASQRRRLCEIFEALGMIVIGEAANGLEALAIVEKTRPDLIALDVIMPVMHGVETLGYIREANNLAYVIYVSAMGNLEALMEVKAAGGYAPDAIFSKKDSAETFLEVLTSVFLGEEDTSRSPQSKSAEEAGSTSGGRAVS